METEMTLLHVKPSIEPGVPKLRRSGFFGNAFEFKKDRLGLFLRTFENCGDLGVYSIGKQDFYLVNSVGLIHEILIKHGNQFEKTDRFRAFARPLLGEGLLTATNADHKLHRRLIQPKFNKAAVRGSADIAATVAEQVATRWSDDDVVDLRREMVQLVLAIIGRNLFSRDILHEADDLGNALTDAIHGFDSQASAMIPLTIEWPTPANLRYRRAIQRLERTFYAFLQERRASTYRPDDWLNMLMECQDQGDTPISDRQLRDAALNMFMPGHETTATALTWSFHLLAEHPAAYECLLAEVDQVLGDRAPTLADLPRLPYTLQVFKEAMRLYPPVYMFTRQAVEDVTVAGYRIPAGTALVFSPYALHRRADYFEDPERFDPGRFSQEREAALPRHAYLPFGAGHRVCIGNNHALLSGQVVLATLAQQVRLSTVPGAMPVKEAMVTLRPKGGLRMKVSRRAKLELGTAVPNKDVEADGCPCHPSA
jgi:cytochrome P450